MTEPVEAEQQAEMEPRTCGAAPPGYDFIACEREPGHSGRHWCATLNWPAS